MLRLLSSKIFREDLSEYALPMLSFEDFEDIENLPNMSEDTFKFCLPVSVGDFSETNVPACFSNEIKTLRDFVEQQKIVNNRKAFIISDFGVSDIDDILYSGIICVSSKYGMTRILDKSTTISLSFKNPIKTYAQEGISPRDLDADIQLTYDHIGSENHAFPSVKVNSKQVSLKSLRYLILDAFRASSLLHRVSALYDGNEYTTYTLFFVDKQKKIRLYEVIGEEAFLGKRNQPYSMLREELDLVKSIRTRDDVRVLKKLN